VRDSAPAIDSPPSSSASLHSLRDTPGEPAAKTPFPPPPLSLSLSLSLSLARSLALSLSLSLARSRLFNLC